MLVLSDYRRFAMVLFVSLFVLLLANTASTQVPVGDTIVADGIRLRYVEDVPVTCAADTTGTIVNIGFNNNLWQTCICDLQPTGSYDWQDFFDGGYCAWEGPV